LTGRVHANVKLNASGEVLAIDIIVSVSIVCPHGDVAADTWFSPPSYGICTYWEFNTCGEIPAIDVIRATVPGI